MKTSFDFFFEEGEESDVRNGSIFLDLMETFFRGGKILACCCGVWKYWSSSHLLLLCWQVAGRYHHQNVPTTILHPLFIKKKQERIKHTYKGKLSLFWPSHIFEIMFLKFSRHFSSCGYPSRNSTERFLWVGLMI